MQYKQQLINDTLQLPLIIYYQGNYQDIPTEVIIHIIESNERMANRKNQLRKIMFLSVEAIQNIQRYSAHMDHSKDLYLMFYDNNSYQVVTQNLIYSKKIEELKGRLDTLASKAPAELDEIYMTRVDSEETTEKGAGLGLIEIARKSNRTFRYDFKKVDDEFSIFNLYFAIPITIKEESAFDFSKAISVQNTLNKLSENNQSCFYYGGDFSNSFISSLLNLLMSKKEEKNNANKKVHHILIELIQNIKRHAVSESGSLHGRICVEWKDKYIEVTTYNSAISDSANQLQKKVVDLNNSSKEQLALKSKEILSDLESTNGLGLIDVANLIHPNKMNLTICKESNGFSELLFNIKITNE